MHLLGDRDKAKALFTESIRLFEVLGLSWSIADCLIGFAAVAISEDQMQRAATLIGAADMLRPVEGDRMITPATFIVYKNSVEALGNKLDPKLLSDGWKTGRAMVPEHAIAFATEVQPKLSRQRKDDTPQRKERRRGGSRSRTGTDTPARTTTADQSTTTLEEQRMDGLDPILDTALRQGVIFLYEQAAKFMQERREARKQMGEDDDTPQLPPSAKPTTQAEVESLQPKNVYLKDIPEEIQACIDQIHRYRRNRRNLETRIADDGGYSRTLTSVRSELRDTDDQIKRLCQKLKDIIEEAYGHKINFIGLT